MKSSTITRGNIHEGLCGYPQAGFAESLSRSSGKGFAQRHQAVFRDELSSVVAGEYSDGFNVIRQTVSKVTRRWAWNMSGPSLMRCKADWLGDPFFTGRGV